MTEEKSYKSIFKATSLFGSVQIISIIISVIKSKLVALWIGTAGFGVISIFNSSISLITTITNLGLQSSAVRDISANISNVDRLSETVSVTSKLAWMTSIIGGILTVLLSPILSLLFFHNYDFTISFILIALVIYATGMYNQYYAILQGTRQLKKLAASNLIGVLIGLFLSMPCFFFFRMEGIVPSLILSAASLMIVSLWYVRRLDLRPKSISLKQALSSGKATIRMGIYIALSNNVTFLTMFLLKAYISNAGTIEDVGLFQAGWSLNAQYIGLILTAMSKDYFPRLCQNAKDNNLIKKTLNEQGEIGLLLLVPMLTIMLSFVPLFIKILYTDDFLSIVPMTKYLLVGTIIQIAGWGMGYVFLAKNEGKIYFFNEVGTKIILFPLYLLGYMFCGLDGLGIAFILNNVFYLIWISIVAHKRYAIQYSANYYKQFVIVIAIMYAYLFVDMFIEIKVLYKILLCVVSIVYSFCLLNSKINIISKIIKK